MPELSSVKRVRAICAATGKAYLAALRSQAHCLYPIQIIREQAQNIVTRVNADKGVFIGFLFPTAPNSGAESSVPPQKFFYPRAIPAITGLSTNQRLDKVFFTGNADVRYLPESFTFSVKKPGGAFPRFIQSAGSPGFCLKPIPPTFPTEN